MHRNTYIYLHRYIHRYIHIYIHKHTYTYMHTHILIYTHAYIYIYIYIYIINIDIRTRTHTFIHMDIHTHESNSEPFETILRSVAGTTCWPSAAFSHNSAAPPTLQGRNSIEEDLIAACKRAAKPICCRAAALFGQSCPSFRSNTGSRAENATGPCLVPERVQASDVMKGLKVIADQRGSRSIHEFFSDSRPKP